MAEITMRVTRSQARVEKFVDGIAADYAADEAVAARKCRPNIPEGATCYICLCGSDDTQGDLVRECSCRGPHAGFVHIRCLVANAEARGEYNDKAYHQTLQQCGQCLQQFTGLVNMALKRATCLHFARREETDPYRLVAFKDLGRTLGNAQRFDEALVVNEEFLATCTRLFGPDDLRTINAEERVGFNIHSQGAPHDAAKMDHAISMLSRCHAWKVENLGRDDEYTLESASYLANALRDAGHFSRSERHWRQVAAAQRHVSGETHYETFQAYFQLALTIAYRGKVNEARNIRDTWMPVAERVLGPEHFITVQFQGLEDSISWALGDY